MAERHRVWADIEAATPEDAEHLLRDTLDAEPAIIYTATGTTGYNGWANYETWAVNLWLDNEEPTYQEARERARQALADANDRDDIAESVGIDRDSSARHALADSLKGWISEELVPDLGATLAADLLGAALSEVDWDEIASHLAAEVRES